MYLSERVLNVGTEMYVCGIGDASVMAPTGKLSWNIALHTNDVRLG